MTGKVSFALRNRLIDEASREIAAELRARTGLVVDGISDLVNGKQHYRQAYQVLVEMLQREYPIRIKEMLVRSLTMKDARSVAFDELLELYRAHTEHQDDIGYESYRFALAVAITVLASRGDREIIKKFAADPKYGDSRAAFIDAMKKWKDPDVDDIVLGALCDKGVRYQAINAAGIRGLASASAAIAEAAADDDPEIRAVALKALRRISERSARPAGQPSDGQLGEFG
ncbi:MAG TPA: HEAT repeat domain-containing protein [Candidatus Elarobacter sp.]|jgi:HEAT repeat protein|nr:HEAT repeat domain-containing protein [Candidatus Elarobacter sp.]